MCWVRGLRRRASGTFGRRSGKYALQQLLYLCTTRWYSLENRTNRHGASKYRLQGFFHQLTNGFNSREAVCTEAPASESRGLADQSARCLSGRWRSLCENPRIVHPTARANSHSQPDRESRHFASSRGAAVDAATLPEPCESQIHGSAAHRIRDDSVKYLFRTSGVANSLGNPLSLGRVVNRNILPALNRCETCGKAERGHGAGHPYRRDARIPEWHGWHAVRRRPGSNLYRLGVPDMVIQRILRHANVSTTTTYYIKAEDVRKAMTLENSIAEANTIQKDTIGTPSLIQTWSLPRFNRG